MSDDGGGLIDLRVCVRGDCHILDHLDDLKGLFSPIACETDDPRWLGFSAQDVLVEEFRKAESSGRPYDYIAYLEDDILINDADFFLKLRLFNRTFGNQYLLMPNRIETLEVCGQLRRFYIDGNYNPAATSQYRKSIDHNFSLQHLGDWVQFEQPANLHSGCFFLNREQASVFSASGHAGVIDASFHGPLESAATLAMLKTFQLLKPALANGCFLTVEHGGRNFMGLVKSLPMTDRQALIDWPLTPCRVGWLGIQLAQALLEQRQYLPLLWPQRSQCFCDLHWLDTLQHLEDKSAKLARQRLLLKGPARCR